MKTTAFLSLVLLSTTLMAHVGNSECNKGCTTLSIQDITFIEPEEEIHLGFDTALYLPEGFDPYEGMGTVVDRIPFIEEEVEIHLGFDTAPYLPEGFNPYEGMVFDIDEIEVVEMEENIELDFDIQKYLPKGFNALAK
ncbi:hypothetical protein SAMN04487891_10461 [Flagellimonas taeanensis]|uniref:Uncharacterized protein n=1 Tax=Flagellimonas taeanensis TaxID=1005926 RepID=A0A1M6XDR7_9FLAO|nr:hypothetical protein [Allomuricauda taeanensis]SFB95554.1 hypothetical protein SAMN04487891_10461 [Allomuricauda taeanensis]SHL04160.1 hypothetical protein SAMN05216293_2541 [Allomuricauda taeanensis]